MAFRRVGSISQLAPGQMLELEISDEERVVVCNVDGKLHAMDGVCPHRHGPLAQGALQGTMVVCPWHAWEFDCISGEHDYNPDLKLKLFSVEIQGDEIWVDLAERAGTT